MYPVSCGALTRYGLSLQKSASEMSVLIDDEPPKKRARKRGKDKVSRVRCAVSFLAFSRVVCWHRLWTRRCVIERVFVRPI